MWAIWDKMHQFSNLNEILPVPYFKGADFKCGICFKKFAAQIPKCGQYGTKCINFLILTKFCLHPILK